MPFIQQDLQVRSKRGILDRLRVELLNLARLQRAMLPSRRMTLSSPGVNRRMCREYCRWTGVNHQVQNFLQQGE